MSKETKATKAEKSERIMIVMNHLLRGQTRRWIVELGSKEWDLSDRQIDEYIKEATEEINEINAASAEHNLALITQNLWSLFRKSVDRSEFNYCRQILMDIAKLRGLENTQINVKIERPHKDASDDELMKAIEDSE